MKCGRILLGIAGLAAMLSAGTLDGIDLLPDPSLKGWTRIPIPAISGVNPKMQWRVDAAEQALVCSGVGGHEWLRFDRELANFELHVDWRFTPRTSGETRYISGIATLNNRLIVILNLGALLDSAEPILAA